MTDFDTRLEAVYKSYGEVRPRSAAADTRARRVLPAGNTRSVLDFAPFPFRVKDAQGAELLDIDSHRYIDFCGNYTAGLLGHSPQAIKTAIIDALDGGWALGATHEKEAVLAELICDRFASIDQVRFTNSGTEANLMAIGTALHHVGKHTVGMFERGYHGGVLSMGNDIVGAHNPLNVPHRYHIEAFNDLAGLDTMFANDDLGCVVIELVQGSGGCRPASPDYIAALRRKCDEHNVVLIFDEVMTSRLAPGGAQQRFGVTPDMTTLGKYIGGGMTFGAFGGRLEIMAHFDAATGGELTQAGTFNNNVVSMSAAIAALQSELSDEQIAIVNERGDGLRTALNTVFEESPLDVWSTGMGSMLNIHAADDRVLELVFHAALADGLYFARRGFIALSMAITDDHCEALVQSVSRAIHDLVAP